MKKVILRMFCMFALTVVSIVCTACGGPALSATTQEIELGENVEIMDLVTFDEKKIASVIPLDKSSLDTNSVGTYEMTFNIVSTKGKETTETIPFSVVDTTIPEFTKFTDVIYLIKGHDFTPEEYASASDASGTVDIAFSGNIDTAAAGEYIITICATDASGNKLEKEATVVIEDRSPDIRNAVFGDSKETVIRYETAQFEGEYAHDSYTELHYTTTVNNIHMNLAYAINNNDELYIVDYISQDRDGFGPMKSDYDELREMLDEKYGEGSQSVKKGGLYSYCSSDEQAFTLGYLGYQCKWTTEKMDIMLILFKEQLGLSYQSKEFFETRNASGL